MIDFRYHLVSLISVFLALAVGIALGAGPLQGTIGAQLTDQVEQLRTEKDELRVQLDTATAESDRLTTYLDEASAELLDGVLPRPVAVVTLPGVADDTTEAVAGRLEQAGATVVARAAVAGGWTDPDQGTFRDSLVGNLAAYLDPAPADDASTSEVLGAALAQALTAASADDPASASEDAALVLEVLTSGELVTVVGEVAGPADAVVLLAGPADGAEVSDEAAGALLDLVAAVAGQAEGTVVAGPATADRDLVSAVRGGEVADDAATVDGIEDVTGRISVPRALAAAIGGTIGHYGFAGSADTALPPSVAVPATGPAQESAQESAG